MRTITDHIVEGDTAPQVNVAVIDEPGQGGACHLYVANWKGGQPLPDSEATIPFQNGPIKEFGTNGLTETVLLAIVIDRLRSFQSGPFACAENASALEKIEGGLSDLQVRTSRRIARGVEGTNQK